MQLIWGGSFTSLGILFSSYENALNACSEGSKFPRDPPSTTKLLQRSKKVERPSVAKPYSLTDDLLPVELCRHNSGDIYEMKWGVGEET